jgi:predicted  nucleic acid-binding Zn-ribbon protein
MNNFDLSTAKDWLIVVSSGGTLLIAIAFMWLRSKFPTKDEHEAQTTALKADIKKLGEKMDSREDAIDLRLNKVEVDLKAMPDRREMQHLADRLGNVERSVAVVSEKASGLQATIQKIDHSLGLIVEHLIKREGGK